MTRPLALVAAVADNGVIGRDNALIWRQRADLRRFRALTMGRPLIMGRKTFGSIGKPLPGRETVVMTRDRAFAVPGVRVAAGLEEAIALADACATAMGAGEIMVVGGAEIYALALPRCGRLHLTLIHASPPGDAVFPPFDAGDFAETLREIHPAGPEDEHPFTFLDLERRRPAASC